jgi:hypothetical protein
MSEQDKIFNITAELTYIMQYDTKGRLCLTFLRRECLHDDNQMVIRNAWKAQE